MQCFRVCIVELACLSWRGDSRPESMRLFFMSWITFAHVPDNVSIPFPHELLLPRLLQNEVSKNRVNISSFRIQSWKCVQC